MTSYHYNSKGRQDAVTDPKGIVTATVFDDFGRTAATINAYHDPDAADLAADLAAIESIKPDLSNITAVAPPTATNNLITEFAYDDDNHLVQRVTISASITEITGYVYGVKAGMGGNDISSKDLLAQVQYPNPRTGLADRLTDGYLRI